MKALILAAGEGRRLRPLTADRPKPMLPIGKIPLLEQIVSLLHRHGITDIAINLHYKPWSIVQHLGLGHRWGVRIHYSLEEQLLGSAGAAKRLEWYLDERFIVYYGDVYTQMNLTALTTAHHQQGGLVTMALHELNNSVVPQADPDGIFEIDAHSRVRRVMKDPSSDKVLRLANAGILVVEPQVFSDLVPDQPLDFGQDVIPQLIAAGQPVVGFPVKEPLIDIGTREDYKRAQQAAAQAQTDLLARIAAPTVSNIFRRFSMAGTD
jgi:NDP-sugar pyrophosphorylase family protein